MTLTCRAVDREYADCPGCKKTLTIRVLAYKHARFCQAYQDRVAKRTDRAKEKYECDVKNFQQELPESVMESTGSESDDSAHMDIITFEQDSENSAETTSGGTPRSHNANTSDNSSEATFQATPTTILNEKTQETAFEATGGRQFHEKTPGTTFGGTLGGLFREKTVQATAERKKTAGETTQITVGRQNTPGATPGRTLRTLPQLDSKIAGMFYFPHM